MSPYRARWYWIWLLKIVGTYFTHTARLTAPACTLFFEPGNDWNMHDLDNRYENASCWTVSIRLSLLLGLGSTRSPNATIELNTTVSVPPMFEIFLLLYDSPVMWCFVFSLVCDWWCRGNIQIGSRLIVGQTELNWSNVGSSSDFN